MDQRDEIRVNNKKFKGFLVGKPGDSLSRLSKSFWPFLRVFLGFWTWGCLEG